MENILRNPKIKLILKIFAISLAVYVAITFVLPLIWPVVAGYIIAKLVTPLAEMLHKKVQFNQKLANIIVLSAFLIFVFTVGFHLGKILITQVKNLASNWNIIMLEVDGGVKRICDGVEKGLNLTSGEIYNMVSDGFYASLESGRKKVISIVMNNSVSAFVKMIEGIVAIIVAIMSAFLFMKDREEIGEWINSYPFAKETKFVGEKLRFVFKAYLKAQLVIMLGSCLLCFIGFSIMRNPYSLILAIILGLMDALPLLGLGIVLIPWAVVCIFAGSTKNAIVLFLTFVLCYILREILEPRLIGEKVGIPPLTSLIAIYAGYKLFGIVGVILGPVAYVLIRESLEVSEK